MPIGFASSPRVFGAGLRASSPAVQSASTSLASSEGWKSMKPSGSQRRAPFTAVPIASTATRRKNVTARSPVRRVAQAVEVDPGKDDECDETHESVDGLPLQVVRRRVRGEKGTGRARAVDHDKPEGDEAERHENEEVILEVRCRRAASQRVDELAEELAPFLEVAELVVAGAGRREEDDLSRVGIPERVADGGRKVSRVRKANSRSC